MNLASASIKHTYSFVVNAVTPHHHTFTTDHAEPVYRLQTGQHGLVRFVAGYRLYCLCGCGREYDAVRR